MCRPRTGPVAGGVVTSSNTQPPDFDAWDVEWDRLSHTDFELRYEIRQLRARCWSYAREVRELRDECYRLREQLRRGGG